MSEVGKRASVESEEQYSITFSLFPSAFEGFRQALLKTLGEASCSNLVVDTIPSRGGDRRAGFLVFRCNTAVVRVLSTIISNFNQEVCSEAINGRIILTREPGHTSLDRSRS